MRLVATGNRAAERVARLRHSCDRLPKGVPEVRVWSEFLGCCFNSFEMRGALQLLVVQAPDGLEGGIEQLQASIRAEHGDAFAEVVQRFALPFDQAMELPLQRQFLGHIVEEKGHAAVVSAIGDDMTGSSVRAVPKLVEGAVAIPCEHLAIAPLAVVGLLREQAALAKLIEKLGRRRLLRQPGVVDAPDASERIVAVNEFPISAEHRDAGRNLVERA